MKRRTVVSMEQALSLSYATLRFVQLGWRVIRLEATPSGPSGEPFLAIPTATSERSSPARTAARTSSLPTWERKPSPST